MYTEDDLLPLSALQHLLFCERQCALIHLERQWADNELTVSGTDLHKRVDEVGLNDQRGDVRICRGLALHCLRLGIVGRADVVEFHRATPEDGPPGTSIHGLDGFWRPFPVEYKRGRPKRGPYDRVQLCAQALCLEEMLNVAIPAGALYYGERRRRTDIDFDTAIRAQTEEAANRLRLLMKSGVTPRAERQPKCRRCSLQTICVPNAMTGDRSGEAYLAAALRAATTEKL